MSLSTRLARMEATISPTTSIEIEATDQAEADNLLLDHILQCSPGPARINMTVAGVRTQWQGNLLPHETSLALMEEIQP